MVSCQSALDEDAAAVVVLDALEVVAVVCSVVVDLAATCVTVCLFETLLALTIVPSSGFEAELALWAGCVSTSGLQFEIHPSAGLQNAEVVPHWPTFEHCSIGKPRSNC